MGDQPPPWLAAMIKLQTDSLTAVIDKHLSSVHGPDQPNSPPKKRTRKSVTAVPPSISDSHPHESDSDDDFEKRFGHLIGTGDDADVSRDGRHREDDAPEDCHEDDLEYSGDKVRHSDEHQSGDLSDDNASIDVDIVKVLQKVPNWDTSSSITKFITDSADTPLPDEYLKNLDDEHVPVEKLQSYFVPPSMPRRLYRSIAKMKSKGAFKTERAMFAAQSELFIIAKPLLSAFIKLRPLGDQVSEARRLLSISIHGIFSVSLKLSVARRENVRFLFKEALADVLYTYAPRHCSLFGGDSFNSQVEKATSESKVDLSWPKTRPSVSYQPFRNQGFRTRGSARYYQDRQGQRGRRGGFRNKGYNNNYNGGYNPNNKKSGQQKSKKDSAGTKNQ